MAIEVTVRCYCHGLGDCMLVSLPRADGSGPFTMLIDCGIHSSAKGGSDIMRAIAADIVARTGNRIDVIVGTHEHWDHLSAFSQARQTFANLHVGEVWFSWAENPLDSQAQRLDRYKGEVISALTLAETELAADAETHDLATGIHNLLGFVMSADGDKVRTAREALRDLAQRGGGRDRHFEPGAMELLPGVDGVRVYVLGPPRDEELLGIEDILAETYNAAAGVPALAPMANGLAVQNKELDIDDDPAAPFDGHNGYPLKALIAGGKVPADRFGHGAFLRKYYLGAGDTWRRIDKDWLTGSVDMALQLDGRTNNTSIVLAIELTESGRVLLFAADAQVGNWKSWPKVEFDQGPNAPRLKGDDLVRRTVFYKVGHHGSRNATWRQGLEQMNHAELVAFSPTDEKLADKIGWSDFPAPRTNERIEELTSGRFLRADDPGLRIGTLPFARGGALASDPAVDIFAQVQVNGTAVDLVAVDLVFSG